MNGTSSVLASIVQTFPIINSDLQRRQFWVSSLDMYFNLSYIFISLEILSFILHNFAYISPTTKFHGNYKRDKTKMSKQTHKLGYVLYNEAKVLKSNFMIILEH